MGETLGISHNVFEKVEREKDRKERLKKYEEWQKTKAKKQQKIAEMKAKLKEANSNGSLANVAEPEVCILGLKWFRILIFSEGATEKNYIYISR